MELEDYTLEHLILLDQQELQDTKVKWDIMVRLVLIALLELWASKEV